MATRAVRATKSLQIQEDLRKHREHCSADARALSALGITGCQQVRVKRSESRYALYTVSEVLTEDTDEIVRMGRGGRKRLVTEAEADDDFDAEFDSKVVDPTISSDQVAEDKGEFIEHLHDHCQHSGLIVIAPHGGLIEKHTDDQAQLVASRLADKAASFWLCKGYHPAGAYDAWHITSVDIHPGSFPLLNSLFCRRFTHAVAFHGFGPDDNEQVEVLIGGTAPPESWLKEQIKSAIEQEVAGISVRIAGRDEHLGGDDPRNIVNRLTIGAANGVQIEQSGDIREAHWADIATAVANVYSSRMDEAHGAN